MYAIRSYYGTGGIAYELHMEGTSAAFALAQAEQALRTGQASRALIVCPEINSAQLDFRDRGRQGCGFPSRGRGSGNLP